MNSSSHSIITDLKKKDIKGHGYMKGATSQRLQLWTVQGYTATQDLLVSSEKGGELQQMLEMLETPQVPDILGVDFPAGLMLWC